jgi:hypothetical protein
MSAEILIPANREASGLITLEPAAGAQCVNA